MFIKKVRRALRATCKLKWHRSWWMLLEIKAQYVGMAKVLPIIHRYIGQNYSFSSPPPHSDSTTIIQKRSHIST